MLYSCIIIVDSVLVPFVISVSVLSVMFRDNFRGFCVVRIVVLCVGVAVCTELACPDNCLCYFDLKDGYRDEYNCSVNNVNISLVEYFKEWSIFMECEESISDWNCSHLPKFNFHPKRLDIVMFYCSPDLLNCLNHIVDDPIVVDLELYSLSELPTTKHVTNIKNVSKLSFIPSDKNMNMPMDFFTALPALKYLYLPRGKIELPNQDYHFTSATNHIYFGKLNITNIPENFFKGMNFLKSILISDNLNMGQINVTTFKGLDSIERLSFENNYFKAIEPGAFVSTPNLKSIDINHAKLSSLPDGVFEGHAALNFISIVENNEVELKLGRHAFSRLPFLHAVVLHYCGITSLPETLFEGSVNIEKIELIGNNIKHIPLMFSKLYALNELILPNNQIETFSEKLFVDLKALQTLHLKDNRIEKISERVLTGLINLSVLILSNNRLSHVYYAHAKSKIMYEGTSNKLSSILNDRLTPYEDIDLEGFKFEWLPRLKKVSFSGNSIRSLYEGWSENTNILLLDLSDNEFTNIEDFKVDYSNLSIIIDLEDNKINEVQLNPHTPRRNVTGEKESHLILNNNPLNCDCNIFGLYRRANNTRFSESEPIYHFENATCNSPPNLAGRLLTELSLVDFMCEMPIELYPENCTRFYANPDTNDLVLDCPILPSTPLIDVRDLQMPYKYYEVPTVTYNLKEQPKSIIGHNIHKLNLSNTGVDKITFKPTASLKILDLSHNQLTIIPNEFLNGKVTLYVSNNPLECECETVKQLRTPGVVADLENVTCANGDNILEINLSEMCNKTHMLMVRIGTIAVSSLFLIIIFKTLYRHRDDIRTFISTHILCRREHRHLSMNEMRLDAAKQFDLFISYAHQDEEFVSRTLVPKLENEYKQKICIHSRDWTVGDMITDQIISSVERSRRTLIVLSENFLASEWSYLEFRTAHNLSIREGRPRVIIIILDEDITSDERLGDDLKSYISVNTYLLWSDPNFWQRLKKILPRQGRK